jgi:hypothetical protein
MAKELERRLAAMEERLYKRISKLEDRIEAEGIRVEMLVYPQVVLNSENILEIIPPLSRSASVDAQPHNTRSEGGDGSPLAASCVSSSTPPFSVGAGINKQQIQPAPIALLSSRNSQRRLEV